MKLEEYEKLEAETGKKNAYEIALKNYYDEEVDDDDDGAYNYLSKLDDSVFVELLDEGNECALKWLDEARDDLDFDKLAREGHDWAVEVAMDYCSDAEEQLEFLLECADHGSSMAMDTLNESFGVWESWRENLLVSETKTAGKLLIDKMNEFESFDWMESEEYIQLDDFANAVVKNIHRVFRTDEDLAWLERCAKRKIPQAQYIMSVLYQGCCPDVMPRNESASKRYLKAAAKGGCEQAIRSLEEMGISVDEKEPQKRSLTSKAKKGNAEAMFELGNIFAFEGNQKKADMWWSKAARRGHKDAVPFRKKSMARKKKKVLSVLMSALKIIIILLVVAAVGTIWYFKGWGMALWVLSVVVFVVVPLFLVLVNDLKDPDKRDEIVVNAKAILIPIAVVGLIALIGWLTGSLR